VVSLHVEDPGAFTAPWNAEQTYRRVEPHAAEPNDALNPLSSTSVLGPLLQASCAHNPNGVFGADALPIPQTAKPGF
jgi:hypothetical protein